MKRKNPYTLKSEFAWSKPQKGGKVTLKEILKLHDYVMNNKIVEPHLIETHEAADRLNETEKAIKKIYPQYRGHHWKPGDKAYMIMMRGDFGLIGVPSK